MIVVTNAFDFIDKVIYINLDKRTDRREHIKNELQKMGCPKEKYIRFPAHLTTPGNVGCTISHRDVLQIAKDNGWSNVLIFEDDFELIVEPSVFHNQLITFFTNPPNKWDVLFISYNVNKSQEVEGTLSNIIARTTDAQTASGYLVNKSFYDDLLNNFNQASYYSVQYPIMHWLYINDQYWKHLQADLSTYWFYFKERLGRQREGYSDLAQGIVNYGV